LLSPIYCDNRLTLGDTAVRRRLTDAFATRLGEAGVHPDVVAGTATAGIPHAAWLADRLRLPLVYVRSSAKEHGKGNRIEGRLPGDAAVVVVEDTISTGGSALAAVEEVRAAGARADVVVAIFDYGFRRAAAA
jgi:orotate phosphoribosyltransferase